ncbi:DUF3592 domain-containing protein [Lentzea sp. NPDC060358]|uniref:DUF3592 domain-containing protein n=1 Tax=Lentzea sp. NPDC060358 TaxID=3347103 RepID=UPI003660EB61
MANSMRSRRGRVLAGLALAAAVVGLVVLLRSAAEQRSWATSEGTVQERLKSGKSASVRVEYALPDGSRQTAVLSENGPKRESGERVTVRYDLVDGRVVDAALADNDQVFRVLGGVLGVVLLGGIGLNVLAWAPRRGSAA